MVKSPIVGTFYAAPTVGGEPFVTVGSRVEAGQALCIIEAMKLMNEIESDVAGEVVRIFVENGQPVEYGEALFGIHAAPEEIELTHSRRNVPKNSDSKSRRNCAAHTLCLQGTWRPNRGGVFRGGPQCVARAIRG